MSENENCTSALAIVLPSLDPDEKFLRVVDELVSSGFETIVIVDDGSAEEKQRIFSSAERYPQCTVLHHGVNRGKGRALKTAFEYVLENCPDMQGVITIDGDGQHLTKDIIACGNLMLKERDKVVLGCRDFNSPNVPPRSVAGNKTTSFMFRLCYGIKLSDTQTGLRAIPRRYLERFNQIEGERFEYETNMLLNMRRMGIALVEQPIETVYDAESYSSHYNAVRDSWRIFKIMLKYLLSSAGSTIVDLLVFYLAMKLIGRYMGVYAALGSTVIARICSSLVNFSANNAIVFGNKGHYKRALLRYYCLAIPQMLISAGIVTLLNSLFHNSAAFIATLIKICVDTGLFFLAYYIQREWVFSQRDN